MRGVGVGDAIGPVIPIAADLGEGEGFGGVLVGIVRAFLEAEVGRREIIPETAGPFIAEIFGFDQRRFVAAFDAVAAKDVLGVGELIRAAILADHDAVVFGDGGEGGVGGGSVVVTSSHHATAEGIEFLAEIDNLDHFRGGDDGVAGFPEEDAGVVAEVDHGVAHDFDALIPLAAFDEAFLIAGGADLNDAVAVEGVGIDFLRGDVHPAHVVGVGVADHLHGEVVHPVRVALAEAGPFVGGALCEAFEVGELAVDENAAGSGAAFELGFAEAGGGFADVDDFVVDGEGEVDVVEVRVFDGPEAGVGERAGGGESGFLAGGDGGGVSAEGGVELTVVIDDVGGEEESGGGGGGVLDLGFGGDVGGFGGDVVVLAVDVGTGGFEAVVEGEGLVDFSGDVEPDVAVDAAVVGVEVIGVPFESGAGGTFLIVGAVIDFDGEDVFVIAEFDGVGDIDAVAGDAVFVEADFLAVEEDIAGLAHAFEFEEDFIVGVGGGEGEMFAVPGEALVGSAIAAAVGDDGAEGIGFVKGVGGADGVPGGVVEGNGLGVGDILADEFPVGVEVIGGAGGLGWGEGGRLSRGKSGCDEECRGDDERTDGNG